MKLKRGHVLIYQNTIFMEIKVQFFGVIAEVVNKKTLAIQDVKNVEELKRHLVKQHPELQRYLYRVFVNKELISGDKSLSDGDEVAMIPPFVGG